MGHKVKRSARANNTLPVLLVRSGAHDEGARGYHVKSQMGEN